MSTNTRTLHQCSSCVKVFEHQSSLFDHRKEHHPTEYIYQCSQCNKIFNCDSSFRLHQLRDHTNDDALRLVKRLVGVSESQFSSSEIAYESWKCKICLQVFENQCQFISHRKEIHPMESVFPCMLCDSGFTKKAAVKRHYHFYHKKLIKGDKLSPQSEENHGSKDFNSQLCLTIKRLHDHANDRDLGQVKPLTDIESQSSIPGIGYDSWKCKTCLQVFEVQRQFIYHRIENHPMESIFPCMVCDKGYNRRDNLKTHYQNCHKEPMNVDELSRTEESISTKSASKMSRKRSRTLLQCSSCNEVFERQSSLVNHLKEHHPTEYIFQCSQCDKEFYCDLFLRLHQLKDHTNDKDLGKLKPPVEISESQYSTSEIAYESWKCKTCHQVFDNQSIFVSHRKEIHPMESIFPCMLCDSGFTKKSAIKQHYHFCHKKLIKGDKLTQNEKNYGSKRDKGFDSQLCSTINRLHDHANVNDLGQVKLLTDISESQSSIPGIGYDSWKCKTCLQVFEVQRQFIYHRIESHPMESIFPCMVCDKGYSRKDNLKTHYQNCHKETIKVNELPRTGENICAKSASRMSRKRSRTLLQCLSCTEVFERQSSFVDHRKEHHPTEYIFQCSQCDKGFNNDSSFRLHLLRDHTNDKDIERVKTLIDINISKSQYLIPEIGYGSWKCKTCLQDFENKLQFVNHRNEKHTMESRFPCMLCNSGFTRKDDLKNHYQRHHKKPIKGDKLSESEKTIGIGYCQWKCVSCNGVFQRQVFLETHRRKMHPEEKVYPCQLCNKGFSKFCNFEHHSVIAHLADDVYAKRVCKLCGKRYYSGFELSAHMKTHAVEKMFLCHICGKFYKTNVCLTIHLNSHQNIKKYKCKVCCKRANSYSSYFSHQKTHTGEKSYKCKICAKSFIRGDNLLTHMRSHTGEKPYVCRICYKCFTRGDNLKSHIRRCHRYMK